MHKRFRLAALLLALASGPVAAQVTLNPRALDDLNRPPGTRAPAPQPQAAPQTNPQATPRTPTQQRTAPAQPPAPSPAPPAPVITMPLAPDPPPVIAPLPPAATTAISGSGLSAPEPLPPLVPMAPPGPPVIAPPVAVPTRPTPVPTPVEVVAGAAGEASRIEGGVRITFGPGKADLNAATAGAVRELARALPGNATLTLTAFAPGTPDDPSTARRLSLSRALAARSLLIAEGLPSPRITVRSLGASEPGFSAGPPDRVDLVVSSPPTSQAKPAP